jgi:hypothetical protein
MQPDLLRLRRSNQGLARAAFRKPEDVVAWFGAMQAQDYLGSLWGIGQRTRGATEAHVEAAEERRAIVRTWPMRGTLHFVAAADVRWLTRLLAPRVMVRHAARWRREFGVDDALAARADEAVTLALEGGKRLPREQIYAALESRRIRTGAARGLHLLLCLAMRGRLCLAGRVGKQHSFALLDEWIPESNAIDRDAALTELAARYFTSHGPATLRDLAWWAGITVAEARLAVDGARRRLEQISIGGEKYWRGTKGRTSWANAVGPQVRLLPGYDEYTVGYADRAPLLEAGSRLKSRGMGLLSPAVLVDGRVVGTWKRTMASGEVRVATRLARRLSGGEQSALGDAVANYGRYLGLEAHWRPRG